jgi:hypothetical protein
MQSVPNLPPSLRPINACRENPHFFHISMTEVLLYMLQGTGQQIFTMSFGSATRNPPPPPPPRSSQLRLPSFRKRENPRNPSLDKKLQIANCASATDFLRYIHLGSSVCHPVVLSYSCRPVIFLSSCHSCGTLSYTLCYSNQTDRVNETEGF